MNEAALRTHVYDVLVARGAPPATGEIAAHFGVPVAEVLEALRASHIGKTLLVHPDTGEVWMAGPFASRPTPYRLRRGDTQWFANCAWDMLGVPFIVGGAVHIDARCGDCDAPIAIDADASRPPGQSCVVHFLVPARDWYQDIGFT